MSADDRAARLRALADHYDTLAKLEATLAKATDAYRATSSDKNRTAYQDASRALRAAREQARSSAEAEPAEPGAATPQPAAANSRKKG